MDAMSVRTGLVSATFRELTVEEVVAVAARAGLYAIEWSGDVHVPPGDLDAARRTARRCADAGLTVAAYGSYLRAGQCDTAQIRAAMATASRLGAPRVRVWAGSLGTADATTEVRTAVTRSLAEMAGRAAEHGLEVATEFHARTLTDDVDSTITLLMDVAAPNLATYWQPPVTVPDEACLAQLDALMPWLRSVHVYSWWPVAQRRPLAARESLWRPVLDRLAAADREIDAALESVADDSVDQLATDADQLHAWLRTLGG